MNARQWGAGVGLLALAAATVGGLVLTRDPPPAAGGETQTSQPGQRKGPSRPREWFADNLRPLVTARELAALAATPEEQELARQAERLADHAVDLAFADALNRAADNPPEPTPKVKALAEAKKRAQATITADRQVVQRLTRDLAAAQDEGEKERLGGALDVAQAQLALHQDELTEATEDLAREGGDPQARIQRLKAAYEAAQKEPHPAPALAPSAADLSADSLLARFRAWSWQRSKLSRLSAAMRESTERVQRLTTWREKLAQRVKQEAEAQAAARSPASSSAAGGAAQERGDGAAAGRPAGDAVSSLKRLASNQRWLTTVGKRIQDHQELGDAYQSWIRIVEGHARAALRRVLRGLLWVLAALGALFLANLLIDRLFQRFEREEVRASTLRTVAKFAVQLVGVLVILFFLLGAPSQATTILGLAGAGLTVAMKDFIVAFFGWFVLMGRNGIRVGDWVEIRGVGGEVVEIGLLHTVLLETGSWSDAGHPTGRRVSFVNSFAIEGHYFNFSTSGQWMWDELKVLVPPGQDPYPVIDGIQKLVEKATAADANLAEQEWRKATTRYRVRTFSPEPGINVVPTSAGIEIHVRYITRAHERHETRRGLYHAVVELMHGRRAEVESAGAA